MHQFVVQRNLNTKEELPVCPKPRKPSSDAPEFLYPLRCKHSHSCHQASSEILDMTPKKNEEGREATSTGCPPSCYCSSPPSRSNNPLVHDAQFGHQPEIRSPLTRTKLSDRLGFTSTARI